MAASKSELSVQEAWSLIDKGVKLIDVRTESEFSDGHLPGAINISHDQILARIHELEIKPDEPVVLYCKSGGRSDFAMKVLQGIGYSRAINIGGYEDLLRAAQSAEVES